MSNFSKLDSIKSYENLIKELENKIKALEKNYSAHINCKNKCSDCCCNLFNVSVIEGYYIQQGFDLLLKSDQDKIKSNVDSILGELQVNKHLSKGQIACPLLSDGSCLLYDYRPLICRAFGVPIKDESTGQIATCEKNFIELRKKKVTLDAISLRPLSTQMVILSQFLMKELGKRLDDKYVPPLYSILDIVVAKLSTGTS